MATGQRINDSVALPDYTDKAFNLSPAHGPDLVPLGRRFGDVTTQVQSCYKAAEKPVVSVAFVAGNPRNNVMPEGTFLTVERKEGSTWRVVRTDHDYDTRFHWNYQNKLLGLSHARIEWYLDDSVSGSCQYNSVSIYGSPITDRERNVAGTYRIGYFGHHKVPITK